MLCWCYFWSSSILEWLLSGWPDKSHCMVTSVLSNSLTKALSSPGTLGPRHAGA